MPLIYLNFTSARKVNLCLWTDLAFSIFMNLATWACRMKGSLNKLSFKKILTFLFSYCIILPQPSPELNSLDWGGSIVNLVEFGTLVFSIENMLEQCIQCSNTSTTQNQVQSRVQQSSWGDIIKWSKHHHNNVCYYILLSIDGLDQCSIVQRVAQCNPGWLYIPKCQSIVHFNVVQHYTRQCNWKQDFFYFRSYISCLTLCCH